MAGTAVTAVRTAHTEDEVEKMRAQLNTIIDDLEVLRAALDTVADQLDSDAGVTGTDFAANANVATAAALSAAKVNIR